MSQSLDSRFPDALQELWASLNANVVWLHGRWIVYRQLFGTSEERVDILNEAASTVSWILENLLLNDIQLSLSKIGDPASSGSRQNLTLRRLQVVLRECGYLAFSEELEPLLVNFENSCQKLRHRRNKWIAHNDLSTIINSRSQPLFDPSREEIEISLSALREIMNCVDLKFTDTVTAYEHFIMQNDGNHLVAALARSKRYRELVQEGVIPTDDFLRRFPQGV